MELVISIAVILGGVTTGLVNLVKSMEVVSPKYLPLVALGIGMVFGLVMSPLLGVTLYVGAISGLIAGLSAMGFYELTKTPVE
ncbi:putative membrane protein [Enterococcus phage VD13]|uniref:Holin n=2 Tax=Saphexavirus TaxID=1623302 RepID=A0AAE7WEQ5_9CAUD|nr:holin [Enterococcus phage VD13]YP_009592457.1 holin [Enterococcus phage VD13]AHL19601.1 hypothetical protein VD13_016 [Enterococcus phage VD13]AHN83103.1 putative membrane protein [Enterococcus phage VD13]QYI86611.1 holin [Enterococcus phage SSsP-1]